MIVVELTATDVNVVLYFEQEMYYSVQNEGGYPARIVPLVVNA